MAGSTGITSKITDGTMYNIALNGFLTGGTAVWSAISARKVYALYKQQEQAYIQSALKQADRTQLKGDIALVSLRAEHADLIGGNKLAVAASGGVLSGSALDKVMQNKQATLMDERTQSLNTIWAVSSIKEQGYYKAISTAAQGQTAAYKMRDQIISNFLGFIGSSAEMISEDIKQYDSDAAKYEDDVTNQNRANRMYREKLYGKTDFNNLKINENVGDFDILHIA